jgi:hypothetical protein
MMASRTRTTFAKRQKELARQEKQRAKALRKAERKLNNQTPAEPEPGEPESEPESPASIESSAV